MCRSLLCRPLLSLRLPRGGEARWVTRAEQLQLRRPPGGAGPAARCAGRGADVDLLLLL